MKEKTKETIIAFMTIICVTFMLSYQCEAKGHKIVRHTKSAPIETASIVINGPVDLGLSVKWAAFNIGASSPEKSGGLYGWADPTGNNRSTDENIYPSSIPPQNISGTQYDIALAKWGRGWRLPTSTECEELVANCKWTWLTFKGVKGMKVTGSTGNSIFLPAAGLRYDITATTDKNKVGYYWSGTHDGYQARFLNFFLNFYKNKTKIIKQVYSYYLFPRNDGFSIRPVCE